MSQCFKESRISIAFNLSEPRRSFGVDTGMPAAQFIELTTAVEKLMRDLHPGCAVAGFTISQTGVSQ